MRRPDGLSGRQRVLGVVGFFMRRYGYPVAPLVIDMILGPMAEEQRLAAEDLATREREAISIEAQVTEGAHRSGRQED
ncbi:hypothetical protein [Paramicrobacterium chengjingii]|uniref:Uncharacterized protein n=1 Tax=Paramicrobacterium chengjingii TaxID=2769067 RepID=A0ABX6YNU7_9MICO|nr:hypothetical protein [Microbacterium chengjingii]QPZ40413.1 hypothetical protein HCR76_01820 [Microbacterium chengjingii]